MVEFVHVDIDGASLRIGLKVERDRSAMLTTAQWIATTSLPPWTTPRALIDIRGIGADRGAAVEEALGKLNEAIARYENARGKHHPR